MCAAWAGLLPRTLGLCVVTHLYPEEYLSISIHFSLLQYLEDPGGVANA